jgi:uncharacterized membrane protein YphA (DoxX/SURF4 family)
MKDSNDERIATQQCSTGVTKAGIIIHIKFITQKKRNKIIYWIATIWLALGMVATGGGQLFQMKAGQGGADMITHLGYPVYLLTLLGIWKILGTIAVLIPKFPLLKEWAYAGFFFIMTGAIFSHVAVHDPATALLPSLLLLMLAVVSWYFRPLSRKIISVNQ